MSFDTPLRERARGRWRSILPSLGIASSYLTGKHSPCPLCEGGTDRFRFDDRDGAGTWICSRCGAGDGVALVMAKLGLGFKEAAEAVEQHVGSARREAPKPQRSEHEQREAMNALWKASRPIQEGDPAWLYLMARVGAVPEVRYLRFCPSCRHDGEQITRHPAIVAMLRDAEGRPTILHRTYLTEDGRKAAVTPPRKLMAGTRTKGDALRLGPHEALSGGALGIAEGIETALSAKALFGMPCWAGINADGLEAWVPPKGVENVVVFGDNDHSYTGQAAAYRLSKRLTAAGLAVSVELPRDIGTDWNDVLVQRRREGARGAAA